MEQKHTTGKVTKEQIHEVYQKLKIDSGSIPKYDTFEESAKHVTAWTVKRSQSKVSNSTEFRIK